MPDTAPALNIVFHGGAAAPFMDSVAALLATAPHMTAVSEAVDRPGEREAWQHADVIVGMRLDASLPPPLRLRLLHAPSAGTDGVQTALLPPGAMLCNCFGHEDAIAEYVMAALLLRHLPLAMADADLRQGRWTYLAGRPGALRTELGTTRLGLLGWGHIAQAVARRARAFGMRITVANRSAVSAEAAERAGVDQAFGLGELNAFMASADAIVVTLPLAASTAGIVGAEALAAMRPGAVLVNVARGPVVDEQALFDALSRQSIGGAVIDTWYQYPSADRPECPPSQLDFASLPNVLMTPHMSGWTDAMLQRRRHTLADNITRLTDGRPLVNVLHTGG